MADPLYELKNVATKIFFTNLPTRRIEYMSVLEEVYDEIFDDYEKKITRCCQTINQNFSNYPSLLEVPFNGNFIVECYDIRERLTLDEIQEEVLKVLDEKKVRVYIKYVISNLNQIAKKVQSLRLTKELQTYQDIVSDKLQYCIEHLKTTYLKLEQTETNSIPKIQWLGKTNVLTTLLYELWQGQQKDKQTITKKMIDAQKKDLEALLLNNFIDSKGKSLSPKTVDDYLNKSKPQTRAKKGIRIEL